MLSLDMGLDKSWEGAGKEQDDKKTLFSTSLVKIVCASWLALI